MKIKTKVVGDSVCLGILYSDSVIERYTMASSHPEMPQPRLQVAVLLPDIIIKTEPCALVAEVPVQDKLAEKMRTMPFRVCARVFEVVGGQEVNLDFAASQTELPVNFDTYKAKFIPAIRDKKYFCALDISESLGCSESWVHRLIKTYSRGNTEIGRGDKKIVIPSAICKFGFKGSDFPKEVRDANNLNPNRYYYTPIFPEAEIEYARIQQYLAHQYRLAESMFSRKVLDEWADLTAKWGSRFVQPSVEKAAEAQVKKTGRLSIVITPEGAGKVIQSKGPKEGTILLEAIPYEGYVFSKWGGIGRGVEPRVEISSEMDYKATAYFEPKQIIKPRAKLTIDIITEGETDA